MTSNYIYFGLHGDFEPDDVAAKIPLKADRSKKKHSTNPERGIPVNSSLRYGMGAIEVLPNGVLEVYSAADDLLERLTPIRKQLIAAVSPKKGKSKLKATIQVVMDFPIDDSVSTPVLGFSPELIEFAAAVGASIDIDTYRA